MGTPRLTRGNTTVSKLCTKLLKTLKNLEQDSHIFALPFLTFTSLCYHSVKDKALAPIAAENKGRRTSRVTATATHSDAYQTFVKCISAFCLGSADSFTSFIAIAKYVKMQSKNCCICTPPVGFTIREVLKSFDCCFQTLCEPIPQTNIAEFSSITKELVPPAVRLLASIIHVIECIDNDACAFGTIEDDDFSRETVVKSVSDCCLNLMNQIDKFSEVKKTLFDKPEDENKTDTELSVSKAFADFISDIGKNKRSELKQLAKDLTKSIWPDDGKKHSVESEILESKVSIPDSQPVSKRGRPSKRASIAVVSRKEEEKDQSGMFGSLLTSPTTRKRNLPNSTQVTPSPLFSPPQQRPNTISTTGRGTRASTGVLGKRPSSALNNKLIDMQESCEFVVVEASQDAIESAKKRRLKATEHQLEVMSERKDDIPKLFNTLDADSQTAMSLPEKSNESSRDGGIEKRTSRRKSAIEANKKICGDSMDSIAEEKPKLKVDVPKVIEESQQEPECSDVVEDASENKEMTDVFSSESSTESTVLQMDTTVGANDVPMDEEALKEQEEVKAATELFIAGGLGDTQEEEEPIRSQSPDYIESSLESNRTSEPSQEQEKEETYKPVEVNEAKTEEQNSENKVVITVTEAESTKPAEEPAKDESPVKTETIICNGSPLVSNNLSSISRMARVTPSSPGILKRPQSATIAAGAIVDTPSPIRKVCFLKKND